jgi:peptidoglycan/LPS O-acetylase OafA/YrhL
LAINSAMTEATPRSRRVELTHINGLDGLRGLAVIAVVLYHGGVSWANGGFLGVELFFVLSGFLITSLLIREWLTNGTVVLSNFWARRARRLLPALFVLVIVVGIVYVIKGTFGAVPGLFGNGVAALFYYSNWHQIAIGSSYFAETGPTSPFQHTWSLAIEEQFYVIWPLLVLGIVWLVTRARPRQQGHAATPTGAEASRLLDTLLGVTLVMLIASAVDAHVLFQGGRGLNRVYYGTDTRASGLLSGAALAIGMARLRLAGRLGAGISPTGGPVPGPAQSGDGPRGLRAGGVLAPLLSLGSAVALAGSLLLMAKADGSDHWLYPWGFLLLDALSVGLIAVIMTTPQAIANRVFSLGPLRWVGNISYGLYLWHFPLFLWIDQSATGLHGVSLLAVRVVVAVAVSAASYYLVEQPIRQRRWPVWIIRGLAPITAAAGVVSLALAANAAAIPTSVAPPFVQTHLAGTDGPCQVKLTNTKYTGTVAPPKADESSFQTHALGRGIATWPAASTTKAFTTCPPKRALLIGDSIAFTIGVPYLYDEQKYGEAISNAAILGCAFGIQGELDVNGIWKPPPKDCPDALSTWDAEANAFGAGEIIIELGYRDEFNWKWDGKIVHLGEPAFDNYVESRIRYYIKVLGDDGKRKLLFLSVPFVDPPAQANGTPAPEGATARHTEINSLISQAAMTDGSDAAVLNIDTYLSPNDAYTTDLNGQLCRFDGIHVTVYCSELLEPYVFEAARGLF